MVVAKQGEDPPSEHPSLCQDKTWPSFVQLETCQILMLPIQAGLEADRHMEEHRHGLLMYEPAAKVDILAVPIRPFGWTPAFQSHYRDDPER